jgi:hypothetical protein
VNKIKTEAALLLRVASLSQAVVVALGVGVLFDLLARVTWALELQGWVPYLVSETRGSLFAWVVGYTLLFGQLVGSYAALKHFRALMTEYARGDVFSSTAVGAIRTLGYIALFLALLPTSSSGGTYQFEPMGAPVALFILLIGRVLVRARELHVDAEHTV